MQQKSQSIEVMCQPKIFSEQVRELATWVMLTMPIRAAAVGDPDKRGNPIFRDRPSY